MNHFASSTANLTGEIEVPC